MLCPQLPTSTSSGVLCPYRCSGLSGDQAGFAATRPLQFVHGSILHLRAMGRRQQLHFMRGAGTQDPPCSVAAQPCPAVGREGARCQPSICCNIHAGGFKNGEVQPQCPLVFPSQPSLQPARALSALSHSLSQPRTLPSAPACALNALLL